MVQKWTFIKCQYEYLVRSHWSFPSTLCDCTYFVSCGMKCHRFNYMGQQSKGLDRRYIYNPDKILWIGLFSLNLKTHSETYQNIIQIHKHYNESNKMKSKSPETVHSQMAYIKSENILSNKINETSGTLIQSIGSAKVIKIDILLNKEPLKVNCTEC